MVDVGMRQYAPYPHELDAAVGELQYKDGWTFALEDIPRDFDDQDRSKAVAGGLTFVIVVPCFDSYHPARYRPVTHYHPVPAATFNRSAWERWLLDRVMETETHEACEYFRFEFEDQDQDLAWRRPFAPTHGPGDNPYVVHDLASDEQRRTSFLGDVKPADA